MKNVSDKKFRKYFELAITGDKIAEDVQKVDIVGDNSGQISLFRDKLQT